MLAQPFQAFRVPGQSATVVESDIVRSAQKPAAKVTPFVGAALLLAPCGIHVAAPQTVHEAAGGDAHAVVLRWLRL